ncbi:hypothetical protein [Streptomyces vinaceus]|uniref:hypothetical protein n=1 Tax=Streptomyces vinaceus TaxID=1960 RepID=UPI0037F1CD06
MDDIVAAARQGQDHSGSTGRNDKDSKSSESSLFEQGHGLPGGTTNSGKGSAVAQVLAQMQRHGQGEQGPVQVVFDLTAFVDQPEQVQQQLMELLLVAGSVTAAHGGNDALAGE